jgi:glycosyltransferase involved in cell wall biosynthesis
VRFLHLVNVRWHNASAWYALTLARVLAEDGHECVVAGLPGSPPVRAARAAGMPVVEAPFNGYGPLAMGAATRALTACLREFRPDCVVAHRGEFFWFTAVLRAAGRIPLLVRVRADIRPPRRGPGNRWLHRQCDGIVLSGERMASSFAAALPGIPAERLIVLHGGVDTRVFRPGEAEAVAAMRARLGATEATRLVGMVGRFSPVKGHGLLFRAVGRCRSPVRLAVAVRHDRDVPAVRALAAGAGVADRVTVLGALEDIAGFMAALDVGVVSSLGSEAVCRVAMEMMACGTPVIATDVGVLPEIVPPANICPAGDIDALARLLDRPSHEPPVVCDERSFAGRFLDRVASLQPAP